jgi:hypothetical protein
MACRQRGDPMPRAASNSSTIRSPSGNRKSQAARLGRAPGRVVGWDDTCTRPLYRLSVPLRDHQPRRLAGSRGTDGLHDSPLEGSGFEPSVPRQKGDSFEALSETGASAGGGRRYHPSIARPRPRDRFGARKFDAPPLTGARASRRDYGSAKEFSIRMVRSRL